MKKTIRFTSEKSALDFAKKVGGELRDLRDIEGAKSNFKVVYEKYPERSSSSYDEWWEQNNLDGSFAYNGVTDDF